MRQGVFCGFLFGGLSLGRNFTEFQKMCHEGVLAKFAIARLYWHLRQGVFCGLLFGGLSLGPNFAEFQKMRHEGVLAKFAIAWLYGHFGSRGLQQNVALKKTRKSAWLWKQFSGNYAKQWQIKENKVKENFMNNLQEKKPTN